MHKLLEYVCDEMEDLERKVEKGGKLSTAEMQYLDILSHTKKNLLTSDAMMNPEEYDDNYSGARGDGRGRGRNARRDSMGRYSRDGRMMPDQRMDGNYSYNRRGGYSYDDAKEEMIEHLHEAKKSAPDDETRRMIDKWIKQAESD